MQAQLRLKKDEVEKLGAEVYVVLAMDLQRTRCLTRVPQFLKPDLVPAEVCARGGSIFCTTFALPGPGVATP